MNCDEFARSLPGRLDMLTEEQRQHADNCSNCSAIASRNIQLSNIYRSLVREWAKQSAPPRVEGQLLAAFRNQTRTPVRRPDRPWIPILTWASAAALVLAMAIFLVRARQPQPASHSTRSLVQMAATQVPDWIDPQTGDADGFIPLPNVQQIGTDDPVDVVRIELPRSTLIALGYPVTAGRSSDRVEADVVLGTDGLARAVRIVDE